MTDATSTAIRSVCLFCGSSDAARPEYLQAARAFGQALAGAGLRLVYGGGGVGLMGAAARAAHEAGGEVLGVMPKFLRSRERLFDEVDTRVVTSMHERKQMMYDECDAFVVLPGGVGTLEEAIEVLSWKRLDRRCFWTPMIPSMTCPAPWPPSPPVRRSRGNMISDK